MKAFRKSWFLVFGMLVSLQLFVFAGCGGEGVGGGGGGKESGVGNFYGAMVIQSANNLPACTADLIGQLFYIQELDGFQYCNGTTFVTLDLTGPQGLAGTNGVNGANGTNGVSINWLGSLASAPSTPHLNDGYYNSTDKTAYIWSESAWNILAKDGTQGPQGIQGVQGPVGPPPSTSTDSVIGDLVFTTYNGPYSYGTVAAICGTSEIPISGGCSCRVGYPYSFHLFLPPNTPGFSCSCDPPAADSSSTSGDRASIVCVSKVSKTVLIPAAAPQSPLADEARLNAVRNQMIELINRR
ncbi:MAG: hypothetical protein NT009_10440 [Proteobacteria bacterium]|nr:hypothetical protein [Pseudomonadota bacterium]